MGCIAMGCWGSMISTPKFSEECFQALLAKPSELSRGMHTCGINGLLVCWTTAHINIKILKTVSMWISFPVYLKTPLIIAEWHLALETCTINRSFYY